MELIALRNTGFGRTAACCEGSVMMCVASYVYRCYRVCLRMPVGSCRTHISGRFSLFFRRVIALYFSDIGERGSLLKARSNETCSSKGSIFWQYLLWSSSLWTQTIFLRRESADRHHGSNERLSRSERAIQEEFIERHCLSCSAVHLLLW